MNDQQQNHEIESPEKQTAPPKLNNLGVPVAIVIAGALIAGAVYFSSGKTATNAPPVAGNNAAAQLPQGDTGSLDQMAAISASDPIRGNLDAPVTIVEY